MALIPISLRFSLACRASWITSSLGESRSISSRASLAVSCSVSARVANSKDSSLVLSTSASTP